MNSAKLLEADERAALSAFASAASAVIALFGLPFIGAQMRAARKAADLQSLQEFVRDMTEREAGLLDADTPDRKVKAFFEFANFFELQAAALHGSLFPKVTRKLVREKIRDSVAVIESIQPWMDKLRQGRRSSPTTFEHLFRFIERERHRIDEVKATWMD